MINTQIIRRFCFPALFALSLLLLFSACRKEKVAEENLRVPRLILEARGVNYGALTADTVTLPVSGTKIALRKEPLVSEFEITNVELVKVELGLALLVQTSELGARALYRGTVTGMGGRIVLTVNGNPIGARRVEAPIQDGNFYTFVELEDEALGQLVLDMKETIAYLQENK